MKDLNKKLPIIAITLLLAGCISLISKVWMTFPDNKGINEALELKEKVDDSDFSFDDFIPVSSETYRLGPKSYMASAKDMALAIEKSFNARKLTNVDQIVEEFNRYHLPCMENENKLICEYYVIRSVGGGGGGGRYYSHERGDHYTVISLNFEISEEKVKVSYDDQSCRVSYDKDNRVKNFVQLNIELRKRGYKSGYSSAEFLDAWIQECLNSDVYKKVQDYFKTYYPEKYSKAHLGGIDNE